MTRCGQELSCMVKVEEARMFVCACECVRGMGVCVRAVCCEDGGWVQMGV